MGVSVALDLLSSRKSFCGFAVFLVTDFNVQYYAGCAESDQVVRRTIVQLK